MLDAVAFWIRRAMWGQRGSLVGDRSAAGGALWIRALDWAGFGWWMVDAWGWLSGLALDAASSDADFGCRGILGGVRDGSAAGLRCSVEQC